MKTREVRFVDKEPFVDNKKTIEYKEFLQNKENINPDGKLELITKIPSLSVVNEIIHDFYGEALFKKKRYGEMNHVFKRQNGSVIKEELIEINEGQRLSFTSKGKPVNLNIAIINALESEAHHINIRNLELKRIEVPDITDLKLNKGKNISNLIKHVIKKGNFKDAYLFLLKGTMITVDQSLNSFDALIFIRKSIPNNSLSDDGDVRGMMKLLNESNLQNLLDWIEVHEVFQKDYGKEGELENPFTKNTNI